MLILWLIWLIIRFNVKIYDGRTVLSFFIDNNSSNLIFLILTLEYLNFFIL